MGDIYFFFIIKFSFRFVMSFIPPAGEIVLLIATGSIIGRKYVLEEANGDPVFVKDNPIFYRHMDYSVFTVGLNFSWLHSDGKTLLEKITSEFTLHRY